MAASTFVSDHCPLLLTCTVAPPRLARFRFEAFWPKLLHFQETIARAWQRLVNHTYPLVRIKTKMRRTTTDLKLWSKSLIGGARLKFHIASEVILRLDTAQEKRTLTQKEFCLRKLLKSRVLGLAALERVRKRQASRLLWLKAGDASTKLFHAKMASRRRKNFIHTLQSESRTVSDHDDKAEVIHKHFCTLLGTKRSRQCTINWDELHLPSFC